MSVFAKPHLQPMEARLPIVLILTETWPRKNFEDNCVLIWWLACLDTTSTAVVVSWWDKVISRRWGWAPPTCRRWGRRFPPPAASSGSRGRCCRRPSWKLPGLSTGRRRCRRCFSAAPPCGRWFPEKEPSPAFNDKNQAWSARTAIPAIWVCKHKTSLFGLSVQLQTSTWGSLHCNIN